MGKFVIKTAKSGNPFFSLKASNGQVIGVSEMYNSMTACKNGIESVRKNAPIAGIEDQTIEGYQNIPNPAFELYKGKNGEFYFRLKAKNGEPILRSEGYKGKDGCKNGIASVKRNAPDALVIEEEK